MLKRDDVRGAHHAVAVVLAVLLGCAADTPKPTTVRVGRHRVVLTPPAGWEHLDHGREQLFRQRDAELEISLADLGPVARGVQPLSNGSLPPDSLELLATYALQTTEDQPGREIAHEERRTIHGATWIVVDTWSAVSHMDRRRMACVDDGGYLLALRTKRGAVERTGLVFEGLLQSIVAEPDTTRAL